MALTILTNIPALKAANQLAFHTAALNLNIEELSTGERDLSKHPADLAIADRLRIDIRIANAAIQNTNHGISFLAVADAGLTEINHLLHRSLELGIQSTNGFHNPRSREPLEAEFVALLTEITRIARTAGFNNFLVLAPPTSGPPTYPITFQVGPDSTAYSQVTFEGVEGTLNRLGLGDENEAHLYTINGPTPEQGQANAFTAVAAVRAALEELGGLRGTVNAAESQLSHQVNHLSEQRDIYGDAESRIRSSDVATTATNFVANQIRRDFAGSILAQANQKPNDVLRLLLNINST